MLTFIFTFIFVPFATSSISSANINTSHISQFLTASTSKSFLGTEQDISIDLLGRFKGSGTEGFYNFERVNPNQLRISSEFCKYQICAYSSYFLVAESDGSLFILKNNGRYPLFVIESTSTGLAYAFKDPVGTWIIREEIIDKHYFRHQTLQFSDSQNSRLFSQTTIFSGRTN